jgi:acyl-coenzyme A synthetase/AMP-(fatty) acid ligase
MIFTSTLPEKSHPGTSLYEITFEHGREFDRDQPCYVDTADHSRSLTFAQVKDLALRFGASLKRNFPNFSKGDVVGIYSPNDVSAILD